MDTRHRVIQFDPKKWHEVQGWKGSRVSINAYTVRNLESFSSDVRVELQRLGFQLPGSLHQQSPCAHHVLASETEQGEHDRACEHDFEEAFDVMHVGIRSQINASPAATMFERL